MPTPYLPPSATSSRRLAASALLAASLTVGGTVAAVTPAAASPVTSPTPSTSASAVPPTTGTSSAAPSTTPSATGTSSTSAAARGVLERVVTEPASGHGAEPTTATAWLRTGTARIPLEADAVRSVPTGSTIAVRLGVVSTDPTTPRRVSSVTVLVRASSTPMTASAAVHSVTVVLALPQGARADSTTPTALSRIVTGGVSSYWSRVSDGRITFTVSKAVGWTKLTASCSDIWSVWDQARARTGFVQSSRHHLLVYVPSGAGCPTGLATVGATVDTGGLAVVGGRAVSLLAHELGHNLGLGHSDALTCAGTPDALFDATGAGFGGTCRHVPYGDWYDVMGISWDNLGSLSTAHAYRLGLLGTGAVTTTRVPVRVTLHPVSTRTGLRSLRVVDPTGATYVLEYRPAAGADAWIGTGADWRRLRPGVLLRRVDPDDATQTLLLDATPPNAASADDPDVVLSPGTVVKAASGRVSFAVDSVSSSGATVAVAVDDVWPTLVVEPRGRLVGGSQVTIGQALAAWGSVAF